MLELQATAAADDTLPATTKDRLYADAQARCMDYVFKQQVIAKAFVRAIVYAKYGPGVRQDDGSVALMGPHRQPLHAFEEKQLLAEEADKYITDVYGGTLSSTKLTGTERAVEDEVRGEMNRTKNKLMLDALEMTRAELRDILGTAPSMLGASSKMRSFDGRGLAESVKHREAVLQEAAAAAKATPTEMLVASSPSASANTTSTAGKKKHDPLPSAVEDSISTSILAERRRRIAVLKRATPSRDELRTDVNVTQRATRHFYNRTAPKAYEIRTWDEPKDILRSLHRHSHSVLDPEDRGNVEVTLNVRCLRPEFIPDPNRPGWDSFCCVRQKLPSKITTLRR